MYVNAVSDVEDFAETLVVFSKGLPTIWADRNWISRCQPGVGGKNESQKTIFWISGPIREVISHRVAVRTANIHHIGEAWLRCSNLRQSHSYRSSGLRRSNSEVSRSRSSGQRQRFLRFNRYFCHPDRRRALRIPLV